MPKKIGGGGYCNFIFFLNHVLHKTRRILWGEPLAFSYIYIVNIQDIA
jgi:hypothetical protein